MKTSCMLACNLFPFGLSLTWCARMRGWWTCTSPFSMWASSSAALLLGTLLTGEALNNFHHHVHIGHNFLNQQEFNCVYLIITDSIQYF